PAGDGIAEHAGPELDVLIHVIDGSGTLATEAGGLALEPGALVWLPKRSRRAITAGREGLRYLSVHGRKPMLGLLTR
ncbi:MAG TPA: cupin, partial [Microbacterium sp.]|nr:cupin [Microbacterium sp.]